MSYLKTCFASILLAVGLGGQSNAATVLTETFSSGVANGAIGGAGAVVDGQGYKGKGGFADNFLRNASLGNPAAATTLTLVGLAAHTAITIAFDLALIDSWDSNDGTIASPDFFNLSLDGLLGFQVTAANAEGSFTGLVSGGAVVAQSVAPQDLGFTLGSPYFNNDRGFRVEYTVPHTASSAIYSFFASGSGWQGGDDESWAIDNVTVSVAPIPVPGALPLLATALGAVALFRRRRG